MTDEQEVQAIINEFGKRGLVHYRTDHGTGVQCFCVPKSTRRYVVWPNAGWQQVRGHYSVMASGNGIVNLKKHMRLDAIGQRSDWSI